jgi:ribosome-associated toxin RatA of RatAB toxin-antitoxin module
VPTIDTSVLINAPLARVYEIAKDNGSFPEFMKDVSSLTVVESSGNRVVSDWVGVIPQFMLKVRWRQEDVWDDESHVCAFRQVQGDYDRMEGTWSFTEEDGAVRFAQHLDYEYNVPTLGPLVKKVIQVVVTKNLESVQNAIKARAEG